MKRLLVVILMILPVLVFNSQVFSKPPKVIIKQSTDNGYVTDLDEALRLSQKTNQNVVLIFSASWCGFCKTLKNDLPNIKEFDNKIICILDSDKEKRLARKFKAKSLPTSVMLNSNGEEVSRMVGYEKEPYKKWLEGKK